MSMRDVPHGGIIRKQILNNNYLEIMANAEVNMNLNGADTVTEHGGVIVAPETKNYNGIETIARPNIGVTDKFIPPLPSGLVVDHGGLTKQGTIINDEQ